MNIFSDLLFSTKFYLSKRAFRLSFLKFRDYFKGRVFDLGCGWKPFKQFFTGQDYIGLDYTAERDADIVGSADNIPLADNAFNTVLCLEVLEHTPEPAQVIAECHRILKPEGILYITAPMTWYLHYEPYDFYRFTKYGLKHLCEQNGFEVVELEKIGGFTFYFFLRLTEALHDWLKYIFAPIRIIPGTKGWPTTLTIISLIPLQLLAILLIDLLDKLSPADARGWAVLARKSDTNL